MLGNVSVAIDGPAGAGKSTVSKLLATEAGFALLDTGAMYRAFTWAWLNDLATNPAISIRESAEAHHIKVSFIDGVTTVLCDGRDISADIRGPEVTSHVSQVAAEASVRQLAVAQQRELVTDSLRTWPGVVLEGRDIGTTVLPDATVKFFLTADPKARAQRRALEIAGDESAVLEALMQRDNADSQRDVSPLRAADDAIVIDATNLTPIQVVAEMLRNIDDRRSL